MIQLAEEKCREDKKSEKLFNTEILEHNIITWREFSGKIMSPEDFQSFQRVVNRHRPYRTSDFVKHHFIEDLSKRYR